MLGMAILEFSFSFGFAIVYRIASGRHEEQNVDVGPAGILTAGCLRLRMLRAANEFTPSCLRGSNNVWHALGNVVR